jgi:hypothetical protein
MRYTALLRATAAASAAPPQYGGRSVPENQLRSLRSLTGSPRRTYSGSTRSR